MAYFLGQSEITNPENRLHIAFPENHIIPFVLMKPPPFFRSPRRGGGGAVPRHFCVSMTSTQFSLHYFLWHCLMPHPPIGPAHAPDTAPPPTPWQTNTCITGFLAVSCLLLSPLSLRFLCFLCVFCNSVCRPRPRPRPLPRPLPLSCFIFPLLVQFPAPLLDLLDLPPL